jgi:hypothetical protein
MKRANWVSSDDEFHILLKNKRNIAGGCNICDPCRLSGIGMCTFGVHGHGAFAA